MDYDDQNSLGVPFFDIFHSLGLGQHNDFHYYELNTLFWSLTRLFGSYYKIMSVLSLPREVRPFLEDDIENFIIRMRLVLNDITFLVTQLFPENTRGLKGPSGGTHPKNKEMSIIHLVKFLKKPDPDYQELAKVFIKAESWIDQLRNQRDNVLHYKSKALVFETNPISFALINAAHTEPKVKTPEGGEKIVTVPIYNYVNTQMYEVHCFMHTELVNAIQAYAERRKFKNKKIGNSQMCCPGVELFKKENGIIK